jgi:hypothetical protein
MEDILVATAARPEEAEFGPNATRTSTLMTPVTAQSGERGSFFPTN